MKGLDAFARAIGALWMMLLVIGLSGQSVRAAATRVTVGANAAFCSPHQLRIAADAQWIPTPLLGLRMRAGPTFFAKPIGATALVGPQVSFDALTYVPSLYLMGGVDLLDARPLLHLGLEVARYWSMRNSISVLVGAEWSEKKAYSANVGLGLNHQFF